MNKAKLGIVLALLVLSTSVAAEPGTTIKISKSMTNGYLKAVLVNEHADTPMTRYSYISNYRAQGTKIVYQKIVFPKANLHDRRVN